MTTPEQFRELLSSSEGTRVEFKTAATGFHFEELVKNCVALANEGGGKIIFGVTDKRPRGIIGTKAFDEPGRTEAGLFEQLRQRIPIEEYVDDGRRVLIVHVPPRLPGTATPPPQPLRPGPNRPLLRVRPGRITRRPQRPVHREPPDHLRAPQISRGRRSTPNRACARWS